jgi:hypothetical protein
MLTAPGGGVYECPATAPDSISAVGARRLKTISPVTFRARLAHAPSDCCNVCLRSLRLLVRESKPTGSADEDRDRVPVRSSCRPRDAARGDAGDGATHNRSAPRPGCERIPGGNRDRRARQHLRRSRLRRPHSQARAGRVTIDTDDASDRRRLPRSASLSSFQATSMRHLPRSTRRHTGLADLARGRERTDRGGRSG